MFSRPARICFAVIFLFAALQCNEPAYKIRPLSAVKNKGRFSEFYTAYRLQTHQLKRHDLPGRVSYILEKQYSIYWYEGVYITGHIFSSTHTRDYSRFSFYDSCGYVREEYKYDHVLRLKSHTVYCKKEDEVRVLLFWEDYPYGKIQKIDPSVPENAKYRYVYDEKGNWIKRTEFQDSIATHVIERTIGYLP